MWRGAATPSSEEGAPPPLPGSHAVRCAPLPRPCTCSSRQRHASDGLGRRRRSWSPDSSDGSADDGDREGASPRAPESPPAAAPASRKSSRSAAAAVVVTVAEALLAPRPSLLPADAEAAAAPGCCCAAAADGPQSAESVSTIGSDSGAGTGTGSEGECECDSAGASPQGFAYHFRLARRRLHQHTTPLCRFTAA